jgi:hypothetical protein
MNTMRKLVKDQRGMSITEIITGIVILQAVIIGFVWAM